DASPRSGLDGEPSRKPAGSRGLRASGPRELLRRLWADPTWEVHGIAGGYQGPGIKSVVPAHAEAKVSLRLVPRQSPAKVAEAIRRFVSRLSPNVGGTRLHGAPALLTSRHSPQCKA